MSNAITLGARPECVYLKSKLLGIVEGERKIYDEFGFPATVPSHTRAWPRIIDFTLTIPQWINVIEPYGYFDFLQMEEPAGHIKGSGSLQGECYKTIIPQKHSAKLLKDESYQMWMRTCWLDQLSHRYFAEQEK